MLNKEYIVENAVEVDKNNAISFIYFLIDGDEVVYIGKSLKLHTRIRAHKCDVKVFDSVFAFPVKTSEASKIEEKYIRAYQPKYNCSYAYSVSIDDVSDDTIENSLTVKQAAEVLGVSVQNVTYLIKENKILAIEGTRPKHIYAKSIDMYIEVHKRKHALAKERIQRQLERLGMVTQ